MRAIMEAAAYLTERRRVKYIFFDGRTFSTRRQIEEVLLAAEQAGARWRILHVILCGCGRGRAAGPQAIPLIRQKIAIRRSIAGSSSILSPFCSRS